MNTPQGYLMVAIFPNSVESVYVNSTDEGIKYAIENGYFIKNVQKIKIRPVSEFFKLP